MKIQILDHGYVELVEAWGSDERIIEAARMSTNKGFQGWGPIHTSECKQRIEDIRRLGTNKEYAICSCDGEWPKTGDEKLLKYLWDHKHATPFEMAGMIVEVQAPIFVFREWHRHRTQSYNELSARYTPLPDMNYMPSVERLLMSGGSNKQAQSVGGQLTKEGAEDFRRAVGHQYQQQQTLYELALNIGIPKELARVHLPVGRYSRMRASANLRNWLAFLTLRMDANAQWEIRQYANEVAKLIEGKFPRTYELFVGGR